MSKLNTVLAVVLALVVGALVVLVVNKPTPPFGATPGNFFPSPELNVNGVRTFTYGINFNRGSSSVCNVKSPEATSTLVLATGRVTTATNTAIMLEWGKSVSKSATTTSLGTVYLAANVLGTFSASTSVGVLAAGGDNLDEVYVFAPNTWVDLKVGATTIAQGSFAGNCQIQFVVN